MKNVGIKELCGVSNFSYCGFKDKRLREICLYVYMVETTISFKDYNSIVISLYDPFYGTKS